MGGTGKGGEGVVGGGGGKGKGWERKRPSVETEGRLTIACHMKNLQKIDVVVATAFPSLLLHLVAVTNVKP